MIKIYEAKQDIERLEQFVGDEYANKFLSVRKGLKSPQNDIYYWLKRDKQELIDYLDNYESSTNKIKSSKIDGAKLIYSDSDWKVYRITSYEASKYYGKNTQWCISGSKRWSNGLNGEKYFNDYTDRGIEFYFYINSNGEKYALALYPNGEDYEIFNAEDESIKYILNAPDVKGLPNLKYEDVKIKDNVIVKCNNQEIESYEIPYGITEIGDDAFENCKSLKSITIPNSVIGIGEFAFYDCTSLKSINIPDSVVEICFGAFHNCKSLKSIDIPNLVTEIGDGAFNNCASLKSITIPNSVTEIGDSAFRYCKSLKSIIIPNSVTEIGKFAFRYCASLKSITIPNSVIEIGDSAFDDCPNLTVYCNKGSYAEEYCIKNSINYISK